jgi:hypothetical protein
MSTSGPMSTSELEVGSSTPGVHTEDYGYV